jgi:prefoldin subunit 5
MDEIFGYMPPVAEPPSKRPLLTLLKQARAFGVGVVLATQNPVDLDYKGLSNTGTWFIGRLQTERDKERILDGLEGLAAGEAGMDRRAIERIISGLGKRVFLLHNVHENEPEIFHTRWVMSYLRGPLTRLQIKQLMDGRRQAPAQAEPPSSLEAAVEAPPVALPAAPPTAAPAAITGSQRPILPPDVPQFFANAGHTGAGQSAYSPILLGMASLHYVDRSSKKEIHSEDLALGIPLSEVMIDLDWEDADELSLDERDLATSGPDRGEFGPIPAAAAKSSSYGRWRKEFSDYLYRAKGLDLLKSPTFEMTSEPLESERDFRIRLREAAHERRDAEKAVLRKKYGRKVDTLEERIRKALQTVEKEKEQAKGKKLQSAISFGATLLAAVTGRKALSMSTLSRATTAAKGLSGVGKEREDVERAEETVEALTEQLERLNQELEEEMANVEDRFDPLAEELEVTSVRPRRSDVDVKLVALTWIPK